MKEFLPGSCYVSFMRKDRSFQASTATRRLELIWAAAPRSLEKANVKHIERRNSKQSIHQKLMFLMSTIQRTFFRIEVTGFYRGT